VKTEKIENRPFDVVEQEATVQVPTRTGKPAQPATEGKGKVTLWIGQKDRLLYKAVAEAGLVRLEEKHEQIRINAPLPDTTFTSKPPADKPSK